MWPFSRKGVTITTRTKLEDAWLAKHFERKMLQQIEASMADGVGGDTVSWAKLAGVVEQPIREEEMLLPKDLIKELEKMDEERMNQHLKSTPEEVVLTAQNMRDAVEQLQGFRNVSDNQMNRQMQQRFEASSSFMGDPNVSNLFR